MSDFGLGSIIAMAVLSVAGPYIIMAVGAFIKISVSLNILKMSMGLQTAPSNLVINMVALALSVVVMLPVYTRSMEAVSVSTNGDLTQLNFVSLEAAVDPLVNFIRNNIDSGTEQSFRQVYVGRDIVLEHQEGWSALLHWVPVFLLSELKKAFEIGVYISLPMLVVDLVITAVLLSLGAIMVSPASIALPMKLIFFVSVEGWVRLAEAFIYSYRV